ncbi:MAG: TatD family hydrolase, partial [Clostridiales Family XIII bacterium]|nr:TatD family hydrolase [Clostridiales Family XIII bacterium]
LDYHYDDAPSADEQRHWFGKQLALGLELGMPIAIHDRDTNGETQAMLKANGAFSEARTARFTSAQEAGACDAENILKLERDPVAIAQEAGACDAESLPKLGRDPVAIAQETGACDARILLHCFSGDADEALAMTEIGAWISIAGPVTFKNNQKTQEVAAAVPLSRLLIETDAPYLTPVPHRGEPNMSPYVEFTARKIAELRGATYEEIAAVTTANAKKFYGIVG